MSKDVLFSPAKYTPQTPNMGINTTLHFTHEQFQNQMFD